MRGHDRFGRGRHGTPTEDWHRWLGYPLQRRRLLRPVSWGVALILLAAWTLLAGLAYMLAEPVLGWIAANLGLLVSGGKVAATTAGVGKEAGVLLDNLDTSGLAGQVIAFLGAVLKPAIILVWGLGALALVAAPALLSWLSRWRASRRY